MFSFSCSLDFLLSSLFTSRKLYINLNVTIKTFQIFKFQTSPSSSEPPDEATAQAVANAFLKSVGEARNSFEDEENGLSNDDDHNEDDHRRNHQQVCLFVFVGILK